VTGLRIADRVAFVVDDGSVFVAQLPDGPILALHQASALIWDEALSGDREHLAQRVATATGAEIVDVAEYVEGFVADLIDRGLLEPDRHEGY
jgi:hypothetical protein